MSLYLGGQKVQNISVGTRALGVNDTGINSETTTEFSGILKGENGTVKAATAGTDYLAPDALNGLGDLSTKDKVGLADLDTDVSQKLDSGLTVNDINTAIGDGTINISSTTDPLSDKMLVNKKYVDKKSLPGVTSKDNGKILGVSNGTWAITEPKAKIQAGSYTGNNTASRTITLEFAPKVMFILIETDSFSGATLKQYMLINGIEQEISALSGTVKMLLSNDNLLYTGSSKDTTGNETGKTYNYVLLA